MSISRGCSRCRRAAPCWRWGAGTAAAPPRWTGARRTRPTAGAGVPSVIGQRLKLRRADLRALVGAGTAAAISAAFGAPLTGAFYAFEIVLGAYTPATIAPGMTAAI